MAKKSSTKISVTAPGVNGPASARGSKQKDVLLDINDKLQSSSALNGGFDTLLHKIDKIEQSQGHLVSAVEKIHNAIYDSENGLFAKMSESKIEYAQQFGSVEQKLSEISEWKKHREKSDDKQDEAVDKFSSQFVTLEKSVDSLVKTKATTWNIIKWIGVAVGGGLITLLFNYLELKLHFH